MHDARDGAGACVFAARFIFAPVNIKAMLEVAQFAIRLFEISQGGSARLYRLHKDLTDARHKGRHTGFGDGTGTAFGGNARAKKRLTDVDIAKPRDDPLIQKGGFDRGVFAFEGGDEIGLIKGIAQGFGADHAQKLVLIGGGRVHQIRSAKAAGIVDRHPRAVFHMKHHVVMFFRCGVIMDKLPQRIA